MRWRLAAWSSLAIATASLAPMRARADLALPSEKPAARAATARNCTKREWLSIKHAIARFCRTREPNYKPPVLSFESDCQWILDDLETRPFCDGEDDGDRVRCGFPKLADDPEPTWCTLTPTSAGAFAVDVPIDCWGWRLTARRARGAWRVEQAAIEVGVCD